MTKLLALWILVAVLFALDVWLFIKLQDVQCRPNRAPAVIVSGECE